MLGELFGAVARAATRKIVDKITDMVLDGNQTGEKYSIEQVQKFQKCIRGRCFVYLIDEIEDNLGDMNLSDKEKYQRAENYLRQNYKKVYELHRERKRNFIQLKEQLELEEIGNLHPNGNRVEEAEAKAHFEAFVIVVMNEWAQKGDFNFEADSNVDSESFAVWRNSIDEALKFGIITMNDICMEER